jgi:divalent metal cation (Fe/Co/Zn/Cd) transporter
VRFDGGRLELSLHVKLPAAETLSEAHLIADEVERAIRAAVPEIERVHVHLEPLAGALAGTVPPPAELEQLRAGLAAIAVELTGREPRALRVHREPRGIVAFLTVELAGDETLAAAHEIAARIEARAEGTLADVADVVVHTEPV